MTGAYLCSIICLHGVGKKNFAGYHLDATYEELNVGSVPLTLVCQLL